MIKHLVSAFLAFFLCIGAHAEVVGTTENSDGTLVMELHDVRGDCAGELLLARILTKGSGEIVATGCWAEMSERIGILWAGETEIRVAPRKVFRWAKT